MKPKPNSRPPLKLISSINVSAFAAILVVLITLFLPTGIFRATRGWSTSLDLPRPASVSHTPCVARRRHLDRDQARRRGLLQKRPNPCRLFACQDSPEC